MTSEEIARRLFFIGSFVTTERASVNRIIRVEDDPYPAATGVSISNQLIDGAPTPNGEIE